MNRFRILTIIVLIGLLLSLVLTVTAVSFHSMVDTLRQGFPRPMQDPVVFPRINIINHPDMQVAGIDTTPRHP